MGGFTDTPIMDAKDHRPAAEKVDDLLSFYDTARAAGASLAPEVGVTAEELRKALGSGAISMSPGLYIETARAFERALTVSAH